MNYQQLTQTLVDSFNALADEIQSLSDRKTVLEHKLRFAHEQYQLLADKYAPAAPDVSETLAKLQLPPELQNQSLKNISFVPLPRRTAPSSDTQHRLAVVIREGRKAAQSLASLSAASRASQSSKDAFPSDPTSMTSMSTMMEQDFTVEGKKGDLGCPFQQKEPTAAQMGYAKVGSEKGYVDHSGPGQISDPTPHKSADPICAAMYTEVAMHQPNGSGGIPAPPSVSGPPKCPIRYLDQHSPEEIAHYVSTHKHELPRSHAICLRRYQRNEEQIRKLDAKYGSLVGMIEGLSQLHRPMLPSDQGADAGAEGEGESPRPRPVLPVMDALAKQQQEETDADHRASTEQRVDKWAQEVSASVTVDGAFSALDHEDLQVLQGQERQDQELDDERQSHFDRMLKEVRLGESPSRPWGISVPVRDPVDGDHGVDERPESPPPAPVRMSGLELSGSPPGLGSPQALPNGVGKGVKVGQPDMPQTETPRRPAAAKCPFDHTRFTGILNGHSPHSHPPAPQVKDESEDEDGTAQDFGNASSRRTERVATEPPFTPASKQSRGHSNGQGRGAREATGNFVPPSLSASPASRASRSFRPAFLGLPLDEQAGSNAGAAGLAGDAASVRSGPAPAEATRSVGNVARDVAGPHQRRPQPQPQMLFTGPVFIGYPVEQAIQIMQALQRGSSEG